MADDRVEADIAIPQAAPTYVSAPPPVRTTTNAPPLSGQMNGAPSNAIFSRVQSFFDVDSKDVARRALLAVNIFSTEPFLINGSLQEDPAAIVDGKLPDLWGPIWIYQTVTFAMFLSATMAGIIIASVNGIRYTYNISLLTGAAFVLFFFTFLVPTGLWLLVQFYNILPSLTLVQMVALYGYSNIVWAPIVLVMGSPLVSSWLFGAVVARVLQWVLAGIGFLFSIKFIGLNLKNVLIGHASANVAVDKSKVMLVLGLAVFAHAALTVLVVGMFTNSFNYGK